MFCAVLCWYICQFSHQSVSILTRLYLNSYSMIGKPPELIISHCTLNTDDDSARRGELTTTAYGVPDANRVWHSDETGKHNTRQHDNQTADSRLHPPVHNSRWELAGLCCWAKCCWNLGFYACCVLLPLQNTHDVQQGHYVKTWHYHIIHKTENNVHNV